MGNELHCRAEATFQVVLDTPPEQRAELLARACEGDPELRREVEILLNHYDAAPNGFLDCAAHTLSYAPHVPKRIGPYQVLGVLGEGGMGTVYRAAQEHPHREVAVKVMRAGVFSERAMQRFELEATILGRLNHPGIAQIHEAGMYEDVLGRRPFFAMELVEGLPLNAFAHSQNLGIAQCLELTAEVCDAVHHAHQRSLVHRDLKPANILVTRLGGRGGTAGRTTPKVLDFGVALATDSDIAATTMHTETGQLVGTLPYMSPEQLAGDLAAIDIRSDVYSLGVVLYELLCRRVPFDVTAKSIATAARMIAEEEPTPPGKLSRALRGDLDTIVLKALEKKPERRYQSASDLAADLRRFLRHEPIAARPATAIYSLSRFTRRNRGLMTGLTAAVVMLGAGVIVSASLAVGQHRALGESERQRRIAEAVNEFLNKDLLSSADPANQPDREVTVKEVVDRAAAVIDERFSDQPLIEAGIRLTLSDTYKSLGEYSESTRHAERALELYQAHAPADARDALRAANKLGQIKYNAGLLDEAERLLRESLARAATGFGPEDELTLSITNNLALVLERKDLLSEAAAMFEQVFEARVRLLGEEHKKTRTSMNNLALVYVSMGRYAKAEPLHVKELELARRIDGPEHPDTLISLNNLAVLYGNRRQYSQAEPLIREALEISERVLGPDHPKTLHYLNTLAWHYLDVTQEDEAEALFRRILEAAERTLGADHLLTVTAMNGLLTSYMSTDRLEDAEAVSLKIYQWRQRVQGEDHFETGVSLSVLARIYWKKGKLEDAEAVGRRGYEILVRTAGPDGGAAREIATTLRDVYQQLGRTAEAEQWEARRNPSKSLRTTASGER